MQQRILTQKEIDELFERYRQQPLTEESDLLSEKELDTISEIANICMGTAATSLFEMLGHKVTLSNPKVIICPQEEIFKSFKKPYMIIEVGFKTGLTGFNTLLITHEEVAVLANLMMGGTGNVNKPIVLSAMEISAATEVMNQMIGASATAMSELFDVAIDITTPEVSMVSDLAKASLSPLPTDKPVATVRFEMNIGNLLKTTIIQIVNADAAREEANFLQMKADMIKDDRCNHNTKTKYEVEGCINLEGAMEVPALIDFVLGRINCTFLDIVKMKQGDKYEIPLSKDQQVDLVVNGHIVAKGKLQIANNIATIELTETKKGNK